MTDVKEYQDENQVIRVKSVICSDLPFNERKQIIKENPVSLYEILLKGTGQARLNKIFKFASENNLDDLVNTILTNNIDLIEDKLASIISNNFKTNGIYGCGNKAAMIAAIKACRERAYNDIDLLETEKKKQDWFVAEKKRIELLSANFNKEFFLKLKKQFDKVDYAFEYAVIKLVSKLESGLRSTRTIDENQIDLENLINSRYQNEEERHLLHKLRITRNNYLHPVKEELTFTRDMFDKCLEIIFK